MQHTEKLAAEVRTMRMLYFGDSFDVVKQSLLRWLRPFGEWSVHPMFTERVSSADRSAFERLLDAKVISADVLTVGTDRSAYFSCACSCGNLFLDPDTGLCLQIRRRVRAPEYLLASELIWLAEQRPASLTVVFDKSVGRGSEQEHLERKLRHLLDKKVRAFAYRSHACFIVAGRDQSLVNRASKHVIAESRLPASRFLSV